MKLLGIWLLIGFFVHKYYMYVHNGGQCYKDYTSGKYTLTQYFLGYAGTLLLWPVTIYNNEFRGE